MRAKRRAYVKIEVHKERIIAIQQGIKEEIGEERWYGERRGGAEDVELTFYYL